MIEAVKPLTTSDIGALRQIKWAQEVPHSDGGTKYEFGLDRISTPRKGGLEYTRLASDRV
jgi:hypothetical protein